MTQHKRQPKRKVNKCAVRRNANGLITRSRFTTTHAWGYGTMKQITNNWMQLGTNQALILKTKPLENVIAQACDMIKLHGRHHKDNTEK